jgi:hypothetical protein
MKKILCAVVAMAAAACTHASTQTPAVASIDGDPHIVVRAEAGRLWWSHRAWTEPHALCELPARGPITNLVVRPKGVGFALSFEQAGTSWEGTFGEHDATLVARSDR